MLQLRYVIGLPVPQGKKVVGVERAYFYQLKNTKRLQWQTQLRYGPMEMTYAEEAHQGDKKHHHSIR